MCFVVATCNGFRPRRVQEILTERIVSLDGWIAPISVDVFVEDAFRETSAFEQQLLDT